MNAQIAQHLSISEESIKSVEVWASVLFVQFMSGRPRFVSKKIVEGQAMSIESQIESGRITSSFSDVWGFLKINGVRQGAKLNYRFTVNGVQYTIKDIDGSWYASKAKVVDPAPFSAKSLQGHGL